MIRQPAVAGSFYPADPAQLHREVDHFLKADQPPAAAKAIIVPHAGYIYSGSVAGELIASTIIPQTVLMIGPNHYGAGDNLAISAADAWSLPVGEVPVACELRSHLRGSISELAADERAHHAEHSLEVMVPFLLSRQPDLKIAPIAVRSLKLSEALHFAEQLAEALKSYPENVLLLASSDMNHFLDAETTERLDFLAIAEMTRFDPAGLYRTVTENRISMCGVLPAVIVMEAARLLGATGCELIRYAHSGQVNGDNSRVVGYAGLSIN